MLAAAAPVLFFCDHATGGIVKDGRIEADRQIDRIASRVTSLADSQAALSIVRAHGIGRKSNSPQSYLAIEVRLAELAVENWAGFQGNREGRRKFSGRTWEPESAILRENIPTVRILQLSY